MKYLKCWGINSKPLCGKFNVFSFVLSLVAATTLTLLFPFRDPCGYLLRHRNVLYREILSKYAIDYQALMDSGLYDLLLEKEILVPHTEIDPPFDVAANHFKTIKPFEIEFISYPYEWCFSQLRDAALLTLKIMMLSLDHGMILKDASAYNVQFHHGKPIFIDTLSFTRYEEGTVWPAYRQFCQHFLAPLALMSYCDVRLSGILSNNLDGIPLDLASSLLPLKTWLKFSFFLHIHMHARSQKKYADKTDLSDVRKRNISKKSLMGLLDSLKNITEKLYWKPHGTEWSDYYLDTNYTLIPIIPRWLLPRRRGLFNRLLINTTLTRYGIWVPTLEYLA
jgi:hypothetical protein